MTDGTRASRVYSMLRHPELEERSISVELCAWPKHDWREGSIENLSGYYCNKCRMFVAMPTTHLRTKL